MGVEIVSVPDACTVTSVTYHPLRPIVPTVTERFAVGAVLSILIVTESVDEPPVLCAVQEEAVPIVSVVTSCVPQPESIVARDSRSVTVHATVTSDVYQPFEPAVPVMVLVMTGGVVSAVPVPEIGRLGFVSFVLRSIVALLAPADVGAKLAEKVVCPPAGRL